MAKRSSQKSYSKFTLADIQGLGLQIVLQDVFAGVKIPDILPSDWLLQTLTESREISLNTEKAKSEFLIAPILAEIRRRNRDVLALYSGFNFTVDALRGLQGFCDYLLAKMPASLTPETPIIAVVEAKLSQDLSEAVPQCAAEMFAARLWNEQHNTPMPPLYGAVTTGDSWLFIRLQNHEIHVHNRNYSIQNLPELLGTWQYIIDCYK